MLISLQVLGLTSARSVRSRAALSHSPMKPEVALARPRLAIAADLMSDGKHLGQTMEAAVESTGQARRSAGLPQ